MRSLLLVITAVVSSICGIAQNTKVGDGFGGRLWYKPYTLSVGSYSGYLMCGNTHQLYAWGGNNVGQLGNGSNLAPTNPDIVLNMDHTSFITGGYTTTAIKEDSSGWIWGTSFGLTPQKIMDQVWFTDAGTMNAAFIKNDSSVWQSSSFGTPQQVIGMDDAVRVSVGCSSNIYMLRKDGSVWAIGDNVTGGLANSNTSLTTTAPIQIQGLPFIVDIKTNVSACVALDSLGQVWYWGMDQMVLKSVPVKLNLQHIVAISGCNDGDHFLFLDENHHCYAYGNNVFAQCGNGTTAPISGSPALVDTNVVDILAGETFSFIIKDDASVWAAGENMVTPGNNIFVGLTTTKKFSFTKMNFSAPGISLCTPVWADTLPMPVITPPVDTTEEKDFCLVFPNAFTPNADGLNDVFQPICCNTSLISQFNLKMYNRWGQNIFTSTDIHKGWNGDQALMGVYFYYCTYHRTDKKEEFSLQGDVSLIR